MRVSDNALRKLIKGTFLATLLLAAMEGGKPLKEATWIFVVAVLTFSLTSVGKALRTDTPGSVRDMALFLGHPLRWEDWGNLLHSVQTGEPSVDKLRGMPFFEYVKTDADLADTFNNAMTAGSEFAIYAVLAAYDFSGFRTLVDIGGGHGRLLSMILAKAPDARGVLFDLPTVVDGAGPS